jgi:serine/threonine-protein kinase
MMKHGTEPAPAPSTVRPSLPPAVDAVLLPLLDKKPERRPEALEPVVQALEDALRRDVRSRERPAASATTSRPWWIAAAAIALAVATAFAVAATSTPDEQARRPSEPALRPEPASPARPAGPAAVTPSDGEGTPAASLHDEAPRAAEPPVTTDTPAAPPRERRPRPRASPSPDDIEDPYR